MKQEQFEHLHTEEWSKFEGWLKALDSPRQTSAPVDSDYPALYRRICHHLALARKREYSAGLQQRLNHMALEGHQYLYRQKSRVLSRMAHFLLVGFPSRVRSMWAYVLAASVLFFGSWAAIAVAIVIKPDVIFSVLDPINIASMESMYDPANDKLGRNSGTDMMMFGYYIYNNVSIGFRTFASGLLFGIGTVFTTVYNGLVIGGVATHLTMIGYGEPFWGFVAGHSSFELLAIVLFSAIGLSLGRFLVAPGRKTRWQAIRDQVVYSMPIFYGATLMLVVAAFVEAYWSSGTLVPVTVKYTVGGSFWFLHLAYFLLLGRREPR